MPAATTKADLSERLATDFHKLEALLDTVPEEVRYAPDPEAGGTTPKDIVGHRGAWIDLFFGWYTAGQAGTPVAVPAEGYKWNDLKRFNADLRQRQRAMTWDEARARLRENHARLSNLVADLDNTALYGGPMPGGGSKWTTGRWIEATGPSHYRSAARYIRGRLRQSTSQEKAP